MRQAILALAVTVALMGCSETSTESNPVADGNGTSQQSGNDAGTTGSGSTTDTGSGNTGTGGTGTGSTSGGQSGGNATGGSGSSGGTDTGTGSGGGSVDPVAACTSTGVGIAFQGINATVVGDSDYAPESLMDGCVDRDHSWSGDSGSILTLDAGAVHQMQGVYIWSTFARMEWLKIETSANSLDWATDWHALPTKPVNGSVYYGLAEPGAKRYVRITGYGSTLNSWTNLTEVRWSSVGYNVQGDRGYLNPSETLSNSGGYTPSGDRRSVSLGAYDLSDARLAVLQRAAQANQETINACGRQRVMNWDATGHMDEFLTVVSLAGVENYVVDFDHLGAGSEYFNGYALPKNLYELNGQYWNDLGSDGSAYNNCSQGSSYYTWYRAALDWRNYRLGSLATLSPDDFQ